MGPGCSDYFILSGLVLHESYWTDTNVAISEFRTRIESQYGLPICTELHAGEMLGRSGKDYRDISKSNRFDILRKTLDFESTLTNLRIINVVIDKRNKEQNCKVFEKAWDALINRFENTICYGNFPCPENYPKIQNGLIIVDETDEKKLRDLIRRMRHLNLIPSQFSYNDSVRHDLRYVIEDPLHKNSRHSQLIQLSDVNSYFLLQTMHPNTTVLKHKAKNLFYKLEPILLKEASGHDKYGIVRL